MNSKAIIFSFTVLIAAGILSACNSSEKKTDAAQGYKDSVAQSGTIAADTADTTKGEWEKFKADANDKIRQNEDSIRSFKKSMEKMDAKIKAKYDKEVTGLEAKNNEMKARLTNYKDEGEVKWEKFKVDFNSSMDTLGTDIKDFFKSSKK